MQVGNSIQLNDDRISVLDCSFSCSDGLTLAGRIWKKNSSSTKSNHSIPNPEPSVLNILCLHGFLDNCQSFSALAPRLLKGTRRKIVELVTFDFPGHGKSSHKSSDHPPYSMLSDMVYYVAQVVEIMHWKRFILVGHSMGAMISIIYAGTFPLQIQQLIILDGFGPDFERPTQVVGRLRQHVITRYEGNKNKRKERKLYKTLEDAIMTRQQTAIKSPGNQYLSFEAAREMVMWAIETTPEKRFKFRHDPRLYWPALQLYTFAQAYDFWKGIQTGNVPTLWLRAQDGWPFSSKWLKRAEDFLGELGTIIVLRGSHHFHADPDTVNDVSRNILAHLLDE